MGRFLAHWLLTGLALAVAEWLLPGVNASSIEALIVAALVLGFINAVLRPILVILTLPLTILTLGLFYLVLNGLLFWLASALVPGFEVAGFGWALLGAVVVGAVSWFAGMFREEKKTT